eukprot:390219-Pyramimonas_sp.AAC.1
MLAALLADRPMLAPSPLDRRRLAASPPLTVGYRSTYMAALSLRFEKPRAQVGEHLAIRPPTRYLGGRGWVNCVAY